MRRELAAARLWAASRFPYLASALFAQEVVERPGLGAVAVDERWRLYVDPELVAGWSVEEAGAVLVHHTGHLLRDHASRAREAGVGDADAATFTRAADMEVNDDLVDAGLLDPGSPDLPAAIGAEPHRLAEEYYGLLLDRPEDEEREPCECGSGAHGVGRPWEEPSDSPGGVDAAAADLVRAAVAGDLLAHGRRAGDVPAGWLRWAEEVLRPAVDWRRALAAELRRGVAAVSGQVDYSYRRPARRRVDRVVLPSLHRPVPEVAVVVDTSASMDERLLADALGEVEGILRAVGVRGGGLRVLAVDTAVHAVTRVARAADVRLAGGGGTDLGAGLTAAAALRPAPQVVVLLTDGHTPWPARPPRATRVVVALLGDAAPVASVPGWARAVVVPTDR